VSVAIVVGPQPPCELTAESGSVTLQETLTSLVYQPSAPDVPFTVGTITGGVVSQATTVQLMVRVAVRLKGWPSLALVPLAVYWTVADLAPSGAPPFTVTAEVAVSPLTVLFVATVRSSLRPRRRGRKGMGETSASLSPDGPWVTAAGRHDVAV
jgi:hypothetical protein